jgi:hypothetical protein
MESFPSSSTAILMCQTWLFRQSCRLWGSSSDNTDLLYSFAFRLKDISILLSGDQRDGDGSWNKIRLSEILDGIGTSDHISGLSFLDMLHSPSPSTSTDTADAHRTRVYNFFPPVMIEARVIPGENQREREAG